MVIDVLRTRTIWACLLGLAIVTASCGGDGDPVSDPSTSPYPTTPDTNDCTPADPAEPPSTSMGTSTTRPPTTAPPTTTGSTSTTTTTTTTTTLDPASELAAHQDALAALGFWLGEVDGQLGPPTAHAVTAFQKAEGLPRTGVLDDATIERLQLASRPGAQSTTGTVLEIDLTRQILLVAADGQVVRVYDVATGAAATPTPAGQYSIYREIDGYRHAPLGTLYRPKYFNGGIALHGYTSVPSEPASHGCVRLTYAAMDDLWASGFAPLGTTVLVY